MQHCMGNYSAVSVHPLTSRSVGARILQGFLHVQCSIKIIFWNVFQSHIHLHRFTCRAVRSFRTHLQKMSDRNEQKICLTDYDSWFKHLTFNDLCNELMSRLFGVVRLFNREPIYSNIILNNMQANDYRKQQTFVYINCKNVPNHWQFV